jgi:hypothetical protein
MTSTSAIAASTLGNASCSTFGKATGWLTVVAVTFRFGFFAAAAGISPQPANRASPIEAANTASIARMDAKSDWREVNCCRCSVAAKNSLDKQ